MDNAQIFSHLNAALGALGLQPVANATPPESIWEIWYGKKYQSGLDRAGETEPDERKQEALFNLGLLISSTLAHMSGEKPLYCPPNNRPAGHYGEPELIELWSSRVVHWCQPLDKPIPYETGEIWGREHIIRLAIKLAENPDWRGYAGIEGGRYLYRPAAGRPFLLSKKIFAQARSVIKKSREGFQREGGWISQAGVALVGNMGDTFLFGSAEEVAEQILSPYVMEEALA